MVTAVRTHARAYPWKQNPWVLLFALVASFLWILATVYSIGYMRAPTTRGIKPDSTPVRLALAGTVRVAFSANALSLFVFYEVLTLSTYPLVTHSGTEEAKRAGRVPGFALVSTEIYRLTTPLKGLHSGIDMFKFSVAIRVRCTLFGLAVALQTYSRPH